MILHLKLISNIKVWIACYGNPAILVYLGRFKKLF
nr:MAG TPA: hypothetical protein [Caudoviricetes sp.]